MRKFTFVASILFFLIVVSAIITGSWKNVSIAKSNKDDIVLVRQVDDITAVSKNDVLGIKFSEKVEKTEPVLVQEDRKLTGNASQEYSQKETKRNNKKSTGMSLYIGDSRTVGIAEYANIKKAHFYSNVGMSVYNIFKKDATVKGVGNIGIDKLLSTREYDKVFLMIGINELGYDFTKTIKRYKELVQYIHNKQPNSIIILQANLHVTKERAKGDKIINNKMINRYNKAIESMSDGETIFYIDANPVFDDKEGNLTSAMTSDGVHILAKYYIKWGEWIEKETENL